MSGSESKKSFIFLKVIYVISKESKLINLYIGTVLHEKSLIGFKVLHVGGLPQKNKNPNILDDFLFFTV